MDDNMNNEDNELYGDERRDGSDGCDPTLPPPPPRPDPDTKTNKEDIPTDDVMTSENQGVCPDDNSNSDQDTPNGEAKTLPGNSDQAENTEADDHITDQQDNDKILKIILRAIAPALVFILMIIFLFITCEIANVFIYFNRLSSPVNWIVSIALVLCIAVILFLLAKVFYELFFEYSQLKNHQGNTLNSLTQQDKWKNLNFDSKYEIVEILKKYIKSYTIRTPGKSKIPFSNLMKRLTKRPKAVLPLFEKAGLKETEIQSISVAIEELKVKYRELAMAKDKVKDRELAMAKDIDKCGELCDAWLNIFQQKFQKPIDDAAYKIVTQYKYRVAVGTAICPRSFIDQIIIIFASFQMIKDLLTLYKISTSFGVTLKLLFLACVNVYIGGKAQDITISLRDAIRNVMSSDDSPFIELSSMSSASNLVQTAADAVASIPGLAIIKPLANFAIPFADTGTRMLCEGFLNGFLVGRLGKNIIKRLQPTKMN